MPENLFDSTRPFMTPEFIHRVSDVLNEPEDKIEDGFRTVIPTLLSGLIHKGTTQEGAEDLIHRIEEDKGNTDFVSEDIFGECYHQVADTLSPSTGLSADNVERMMDMIAPVVMGVIGTKVKREGLSPEGLKAFLEDQKKVLKGFTPKFSRDRLISESIREAIEPVNTAGENARLRTRGKAPFTLVLLMFVGLIIFSLYLVSSETLKVSQLKSELIPVLREPARETIPLELKTLPEFFQDSSRRSERFMFSEVYFEPGTTDLVSSSDAELTYLSNFLKRYKRASVQIEAFMEETGDEEENLLQSENRSMLIREELIGRGVEPSRIRAKGNVAGSNDRQVEAVIKK